MGAWGYVMLAYGIVWGTILLYLSSLKRRLRRAESDLALLQAEEDTGRHEKK